MPSITIIDVARRAGVSKSSVSDILNGGRREMFREATVEKVVQAARELGYQAHAGARSMRAGRRTLVGIATRAEISNVHTVANMTVLAHAELQRRGWQPAIVDPEQMVPDKSFAPFPSPDMLAGIISIDLAMEKTVPAFYKVLGARLPIVALYPVQTDAADCVTTDRALGIEMAFEHLWELGHRRIAFAEADNSTTLTVQAKVAGWKRVRRRYRLKATDAPLLSIEEIRQPEKRGRVVAQRLLALPENERPTALICGSDEVALSAMQVLVAAGWRIPDDLSVIGFDDISYAEYSIPPLTTVAQPISEIVQAAVARMSTLVELSQQDQTWEPQQQLIAPTLVVRETTRSIRE